MLSMCLRLADLQEPRWRSDGGRWVNGESWVEPANVSVLVMEINDDRTPCVRMRVKECTRDEADFVELAMEPGAARLSAGVFGTAPLYVMAGGGELHASWDLTALRPRLRIDHLVPRVVARTLTRQHRYTSETLFEGIHRLTERAAATFTGSGLRIRYPEPAEHILEPRTLRPGIDPVASFDELLTEVIRQTPMMTGCVGVELPGGADSGNVALAVKAARVPEAHSFGVLVGGDTGIQQAERRGALVEHCGFHDTTVPAVRHPPFCPETCAPCAGRMIRREPSIRRHSTSYASRPPSDGARSCSRAPGETRSTLTTPEHAPNCRPRNPCRGSAARRSGRSPRSMNTLRPSPCCPCRP
ncbi:hypothetical protein [Streptomyces uncialis]|uniref:hypothetical protein n=1 Tax=Streptomyces uncialis TaxID=1048205 RepID=UPI00386DD1AE|nr:hypothetical protein OG268_14700 [Streptomyces uncialis]